MSELRADHVVVGAGSAGCAVADRLSEDGAQIVMLEAGPRDWHAMFLKLWRGSDASTRSSTMPKFFIGKPFRQYTEADYAAVVGVNLTGFFHLTQLAIAEMAKQSSGHIC